MYAVGQICIIRTCRRRQAAAAASSKLLSSVPHHLSTVYANLLEHEPKWRSRYIRVPGWQFRPEFSATPSLSFLARFRRASAPTPTHTQTYLKVFFFKRETKGEHTGLFKQEKDTRIASEPVNSARKLWEITWLPGRFVTPQREKRQDEKEEICFKKGENRREARPLLR